jgi:phosphatidylserine decarboxylase
MGDPLKSRDFRDQSKHVPLANEGLPYVLAAAFVTLITAILGCPVLTTLFLVATLFTSHFFRDPQRVTSAAPDEVVSPADGKVIAVEKVEETRFLQKPVLKISIFMNVFNVHVNRIPFSGTVRGAWYRAGRFLPADRSRASRENEQNWLWIETETGADIVMTQVAGLIARRIVCWPTVGDRVIRGERFGMIRFGSRMDLYAPENSDVLVSLGDHVHGGETVLCRLK